MNELSSAEQTELILFIAAMCFVFFWAGFAWGFGRAESKRQERNIRELEDSLKREEKRLKQKGEILR